MATTLQIRKNSSEGEILREINRPETYNALIYTRNDSRSIIPNTPDIIKDSPIILHTKGKRCKGNIVICNSQDDSYNITLHTASDTNNYDEKGKLIPFNIWIGYLGGSEKIATPILSFSSPDVLNISTTTEAEGLIANITVNGETKYISLN